MHAALYAKLRAARLCALRCRSVQGRAAAQAVVMSVLEEIAQCSRA